MSAAVRQLRTVVVLRDSVKVQWRAIRRPPMGAIPDLVRLFGARHEQPLTMSARSVTNLVQRRLSRAAPNAAQLPPVHAAYHWLCPGTGFLPHVIALPLSSLASEPEQVLERYDSPIGYLGTHIGPDIGTMARTWWANGAQRRQHGVDRPIVGDGGAHRGRPGARSSGFHARLRGRTCTL
jgi:hypothetical protein